MWDNLHSLADSQQTTFKKEYQVSIIAVESDRRTTERLGQAHTRRVSMVMALGGRWTDDGRRLIDRSGRGLGGTLGEVDLWSPRPASNSAPPHIAAYQFRAHRHQALGAWPVTTLDASPRDWCCFWFWRAIVLIF
ncbi:hypothetical protein Q1695_013480 [Nippostrongylus brasiliensis]|nr:hypothetical protein Q1695_013480 [Nippostrongylus brasiliensis]